MTAPTGVPASDWAKQEVMKDWDDPEIVKGWLQWHDKWALHTEALTRAIVEVLEPRPGMQVLDLACGTGEPAITLAQAVAPDGSVTATDLSEHTLAATREQVRRSDVADRVAVRRADMEALPFDDGAFDAVSCRLGLMFVPDIALALSEIRRVLRPGGRAAFVVWGSPMDQGWSGTMLRTFGNHVELPGCALGVPTPWRFAEDGSLAQVLDAAGFAGVAEERRAVEMPWPGDGADFWEYVRATAAPAREVLRENPPEVMDPAITEVIAAWDGYRQGDRLVMPGSIGVGSARR